MKGQTTVSRDETPLRCSNAVAAIVVLEDGRYLLQHRDDIPGIWYPDHWGCFGGAVDAGENQFTAMARELLEELGLEVEPSGPIFNMDYDIVGNGTFYRNYFAVQLSDAEADRINLGEGQAYRAFHGAEILDGVRMTPYDAFAIYLHMSRQRISVGALPQASS